MTRYFYYYILSICLFSDPNLISLLQKKDSGSLCLSFLAAVPKRKYRLVVCSYFLCPGLSGRPISLSSHCWAPCFFVVVFFSPSPLPTVATENERLECEWKRFEGEQSSLLMPRPPSFSTRQSGKWDCPPKTSPLDHLTPIFPKNSLQERELIPKCTKMCV